MKNLKTNLQLGWFDELFTEMQQSLKLKKLKLYKLLFGRKKVSWRKLFFVGRRVASLGAVREKRTLPQLELCRIDGERCFSAQFRCVSGGLSAIFELCACASAPLSTGSSAAVTQAPPISIAAVAFCAGSSWPLDVSQDWKQIECSRQPWRQEPEL